MDDLHASFDELALASLRRDSVLSDTSSLSSSASTIRRTRSLGRSTQARTSRHPYSSPFALLSAPLPPLPPVPPSAPPALRHARSRSALPILPSPTEERGFVVPSTPPRRRERQSTVGTIESEATFPSPSASTLAIPLYGAPPSPGDNAHPQAGWSFSPFVDGVDGDDGEEGGQDDGEYDSDPAVYYHPNSAVVFGGSGSGPAPPRMHRSLSASTASSHHSSIRHYHRPTNSQSTTASNNTYPYRPSISSESAPLLPPPPSRPTSVRARPRSTQPRPQTTNNLPPSQKEALRRTTRKLEKVLGEVPQLDGGKGVVKERPKEGGLIARGISMSRGRGRGRASEEAERLRMRVSEGGRLVVSPSPSSGSTPTQSPPPPPIAAPAPAPAALRHFPSASSLSSTSFRSFTTETETDTPTAEEERRRRRQTLQKVHRYLGVVVPPEVVSGVVGGSGAAVGLSPALAEGEGKGRLGGLMAMFGRSVSASASVAVGPGTQVKDDMFYVTGMAREMQDVRGVPGKITKRPSTAGGSGSRASTIRGGGGGAMGAEERARNVKRAAKMEQVFGSAPPPALYLSRPAASSPATSSSSSPGHLRSSTVPHRRARSHESPRRSSVLDNGRAGRASEDDVGERERAMGDGGEEEEAAEKEGRGSYSSWRRSLASLDYLVESGNRDSLASLLAILTSDEDSPPPSSPPLPPSSPSTSPTPYSPYTTDDYAYHDDSPPLSAPPPAWKRAAKLRKFFGVSYRELFDQLLERIECGAREDRERGCLTGEEYESVLRDLRALKGRREGLDGDMVGRAH